MKPIIRVLLGALLLVAIVAPAHAAVWYVNDTSTTGDSFTSAVGNNANSGTAIDSPKRMITAMMSLVSA